MPFLVKFTKVVENLFKELICSGEGYRPQQRSINGKEYETGNIEWFIEIRASKDLYSVYIRSLERDRQVFLGSRVFKIRVLAWGACIASITSILASTYIWNLLFIETAIFSPISHSRA